MGIVKLFSNTGDVARHDAFLIAFGNYYIKTGINYNFFYNYYIIRV